MGISTGNTCVGVSFRPEGVQLYWKENLTQVVSCGYSEIFKNTYFEKHMWMAFNCFNGSLLHKSKGSSWYDDIRLHGPNHRSWFLFLSQYLSFWTECQPAFENYDEMNTFDESIKFYSGCFWSFRWSQVVLDGFISF